jgi:hypothetical protein
VCLLMTEVGDIGRGRVIRWAWCEVVHLNAFGCQHAWGKLPLGRITGHTHGQREGVYSSPSCLPVWRGYSIGSYLMQTGREAA